MTVYNRKCRIGRKRRSRVAIHLPASSVEFQRHQPLYWVSSILSKRRERFETSLHTFCHI